MKVKVFYSLLAGIFLLVAGMAENQTPPSLTCDDFTTRLERLK